jgi:hypothetical protein
VIVPIRFAGSDRTSLTRGTYMWILAIRFELDDGGDDQAVINHILDAPQYGYDFASPFDGAAGPSHPDLHGRWWRKSITVDRFQECGADRAIEVVRSWAEDDWEDPCFVHTDEVLRGLEGVYSVLGSGRVFQLINPPVDCEHSYGWVMGGRGFHEFVVIDRPARTATLVVTCDD